MTESLSATWTPGQANHHSSSSTAGAVTTRIGATKSRTSLESHRIIALDQRGHGESDKPDQDYTIPGFIDDLAWFISELGLDRPVVVGHSMGGVIALNLARKHPGLTRGIVMVDSPVVPLPDAMKPMVEALLAGFQSPAYSSVAEGFARTTFFNQSTPASLVDELVPSLAASPQRLMHTAMASLLQPSSIEPGGIPVPALFIEADTGADTRLATEEAVVERYPGVQYRSVKAAHFIQMEKPEETNQLVEEFLEKLP